MVTRWIGRCVGFWVVAGVCCLLWAQPARAAGSTAKAHLAEARAAAALWHADAVLVTVSALQAAEDGTAPLNIAGWIYTFFSKQTKTWVGFHVTPEGLEKVDLPAGLTEPLPAAFVDSGAVLVEVRKHGFQLHGTALLELMPQVDANLKPGVYWCAAAEKDISAELGMRGYCVDPASGKFVARMAGGPVAKPAPAAKAATDSGDVLAGLDPAQCGGFSTEDAAAILGVAPGALARQVAQVHAGLWRCRFATNDGGQQVLFTIVVAKAAAAAAAAMEAYRNQLDDNYSDLMGIGDEGVWTEVDHTVTYRKQNVTIHVQRPPEKISQLKVVKAIFDKN